MKEPPYPKILPSKHHSYYGDQNKYGRNHEIRNMKKSEKLPPVAQIKPPCQNHTSPITTPPNFETKEKRLNIFTEDNVKALKPKSPQHHSPFLHPHIGHWNFFQTWNHIRIQKLFPQTNLLQPTRFSKRRIKTISNDKLPRSHNRISKRKGSYLKNILPPKRMRIRNFTTNTTTIHLHRNVTITVFQHIIPKVIKALQNSPPSFVKKG